MKITVKKLDGSQEPLDLNKILRWGSWAASESPSISLESVLTFSATAFYDGITTSEITLSICKACEDLAKASADEGDFKLTEEYMNLARNLYIPSLLKKANYFQAAHLTPEDYLDTVFETKPCTKDIVPLQRFKIKSLIKLGINLKTYDPELLDGTLHDDIFDLADQILDYTRMHLHPYGGLRQVEAKYLRRVDDNILEDPEQLYILMALAATHSDAKVYPEGNTFEFQKEAVENYYRIFSTGETNLPTPFLLSLRTDFKQYDSCCLLSIDDTNLSIKAGTGTAMDATVAGAGVGVSMGRIRSKGTRFRKMGKHQGTLGYLGQLTKTVKASNQECYGEDHLILTSKGFIPFKDVKSNTLVAQVDEYNTTTFVQPTKIFEYDYSGPMYSFKEKSVDGIDLLVTPNHEMIYRKKDKVKFKTKSAENFKPSDKNGFVTTTVLSRKEISLTRMSTILSVLALEYSGYDDNGTLVFASLSPEAATLMSDSIPSSKIVFNGDDSLLCTNYPADLVVPFESLLIKAQPHHLIEATSLAQRIRSQSPEQGNLPYQEQIDLLPTLVDFQDEGYISGGTVDKTVVPYNGKVYCVEVPTHRLIVKRPGHTQVVCGNSRGGGATVNFPLWTRDIFDLIMLKDVTGVEGENRYRHLDYAFHFSKYLVNKLEMNEKILLVSPNTLVAPGITVYDAFYHVDGQGNYDGSLFEKFCEEQLKNPDLPYLTNTNSSTISAGTPAYTTAYDLFSALVEQMMNTGRIYTLNMDNVNNHSAYLDAIEMSNLCLSKGTPVLTRSGYQLIEDLEDQNVEVWNGNQWSKTIFKKTSDLSKILKVSFSDGSEIYATEYHKWYVHTSPYEKKAHKGVMKRTNDLVVGDSIQRHDYNYITESDLVLDKAYTNGFYSGDGHFDKAKNKACAWVYAPKMSVIPHLEADFVGTFSEQYQRVHVTFSGLRDKFFVPLGYSTASKLDWLSGLLDADGSVLSTNDQDQVQLTSTNKSFLLDVRLLLSELGVKSHVKLSIKAGSRCFHEDQKEYDTADLYRLTISGYFTTKLLSLGLNTQRLVFKSNSVLSDRGQFVTVTSVEDLNVFGPTWCCNEPLEHKFVANGILTGNCMEILQPTYPVSLAYNSKENIYTPDPDSEVSFCQLAGIVVGQHVTLEDIPRITYWTLRLQEAIFNISDYSQISFSDKQKKRRNVGIGLVNLQHLLVREVYSKYPQKDWVREVGRVTHEWYESIQYHLILASTQLAEILGPCEMIDRSRYGHGILPIDHAVESPLTDFPLKQDWEGTLRPRLIKFKTRFSVHSALMPAESSSVVFGTINGKEFPRQPATFKGNKKLSVLVLVPEIAKYGKDYVYAWGDYSVDVNDIYLSSAANITKFLDQSISYNTYVDYNKFANNKVDELWAINTLIVKPSKAGIKTTYYINFNVDIKEKLDVNASEELSEEEKQFYDNLRQLEQDNGSGCSSGSCSL